MVSADNSSILVIDDNENNLRLIGNILMEENYLISLVSSGVEAYEAIENCVYDLILLDINMPGLSGFDVCQTLKSNESTKNIPVIFITGELETEYVVKAFNVGGSDYIAKPFRREELLARIETHLKLKNQKERIENINKILEDSVTEKTAQLNDALSKLERLEKAKSDVLGLIAHELKTPLTVILGVAKYLNSTIIDEDTLDLLEDLTTSANRLRDFSDTALLITNLKFDNIKLAIEEFEIIEMIESIIFSFKDAIETKKLIITTNINIRNSLITFDSAMIRFSINSLIDNAIKFSEPCKDIQIQLDKRRSFFVISVINEGEIVDKESIFEFFNVNNLMLHTEGRGLSLAAVKMIMDAHQGKITAGSKDGKTEFKLFLPLHSKS